MHKGKGASRADWQTPRWIVQRCCEVVGGPIALDPATSAANPVGALTYYTIEDDGLSKPWVGHSVFLNPPWSRKGRISIKPWLQRARDARNNAFGWTDYSMFILVSAAMNSLWFHEFLGSAARYFFPRGRVAYDSPDPELDPDAPGFDSVLCYYGTRATRFDSAFESAGIVLG